MNLKGTQERHDRDAVLIAQTGNQFEYLAILLRQDAARRKR